MDLSTQLADGHGYLGYVVGVVLIASVVRAFMQGRSGADFAEGLPKLAGLLLALQFLYGAAVYIQGSAWDRAWPLAIVHPIAMLAAVALAGMATAKAGRAEDAAGSWGLIVRFQGLALIMVVIGIGAASAA